MEIDYGSGRRTDPARASQRQEEDRWQWWMNKHYPRPRTHVLFTRRKDIWEMAFEEKVQELRRCDRILRTKEGETK